MQKIITIFFLFSFVTNHSISYGQGMTSREVKKIADSFIDKLKNKNQAVHGIIVSDFTDGKVAPTELGRFLAEEFSFYLSDLEQDKFSVLDRSKLEELLKEQGLIRDELIDPMSVVKLGKLRGMKYLIYGTIIDSGESYTIYVKLIEVETQKILVSTRGSISKVPSLPKHSE